MALLDFVKADLTESEANYEDSFVKQLQNSVRQIKANRKMGEHYMMFEQYMQEYIQEHADEIRKEAWTDGMEKGLAEGKKTGAARVSKLCSLLLSANRVSDLRQALQDPEYQETLCREFGI